MTDNPRVPLGAWLADLPDDRLVRLLELRPDLTQPPPGNIAALAARAQARQSVKAAGDDLDFVTLAVLDALLVLHADTAPVPTAKLTALLGDRAPNDVLTAALDVLQERGLVWGEATLRVVAEAPAALPWHPGQVTLESAARPAAEIAAQIDALGDAERELLDRLLSGSPVGRTRDAAPGTPPDRPVQRLLTTGLLRQIDDQTVILPRVVAQVLRGEEPGPVNVTAPTPAVSTTTAADVDAAAAGAVIDLLRETELLLETLGATPVPELRSGGLGVREVKRLTKLTGVDEQRLGLLLEISAAAGLIAAGLPRPEPLDGEGPYWAPTAQSDRFNDLPAAERWHLMATTWLSLPSRPGLAGRRGPDNKPIAALSDALFSTAAPLDRRLLLGFLAELPPGVGIDAREATRTLLWRRPRWALRLQPGPVADLVYEATALGLVGRGALSTPARALLSGAPTDDTVAAMDRVLPESINYFLLQADLTVVVPGPLRRELADQLAEVATVESAGAAMVYRISESSIRRALDIGRTAGSLQQFFLKHSKTPVPQGLKYLIDDLARRHGQLRVGIAASFVRCDDAALLAQVAAAPLAEALQLRLLAPTVAVAQAPIAEVLAALREAGFAPAAEDATGAIVDLRARGARVADMPHRRSYRSVNPPTTQTLEAIVAMLRRVAAAAPAMRIDAGTAVVLLQQAVRDQTSVVMGYVDPAGVATQRVVSPISVRGGQLIAFDPASGRVREFAVHRVTSVVSVDEG
ncbi:MAG: helicase-associated domain-containing protein [Mycobacteriaceae bacterium]|nr:helicase-associated domain-containing protein [Mycobacteriaceae bacterium]